MAFTKLYFTTATAPYTPATIRGAWDDTAGAVTKALSPIKLDGGVITTVARAETNAAANYDVLLYRGISGPLAAQTINCNFDVVLGVNESAADADFAWHIHVYVTQGDSDTPRGTLINNYVETTANEWATTNTGQALAAAQATGSLAVSAGDRIVVEIGYVALNATATSKTGTLRYGTEVIQGIQAGDLTAGSTSVTTLAGFVSFSASISEQAGVTRVSHAYAEVIDAGAPNLRVTHAYAEAIDAGAPNLRISHAYTEVLVSLVGQALELPFISSGSQTFAPSVVLTDQFVTLPFISSGAQVFPPADVSFPQTRLSQSAVEILLQQTPTVRNTQSAIEILLSQNTLVRNSQAAIEILLQSADPAPPFTGVGLRWWAEFYFDSGVELVSPWALQHEPTYYGGLKKGVVEDITPIVTSASEDDGLPQTMTFKMRLADHDRRYRTMLDTEYPWYRVCIIRMADDAMVAAGQPAHVVFVGAVENMSPTPDRVSVDITIKDYTISVSGVDESELVIPKGERTRTSHPTAPSSALKKCQQWVFGNMVDQTSTANPPKIYADPARGSFWAAEVPTNLEQYRNFPRSLWFMGWANITAGPAPPTNVVATAVGGGTINPGDFPGDLLYVQVTAVSTTGIEGDPHIFNTLATTSVLINAANRAIQVSWTPSVSPTVIGYRVYLGYDFFNLSATPPGNQYLETFGSPVTFTRAPRQGVQADTTNITPGAHLVSYSRSRFYVVQAVTPSGLTAVSQICWNKSYPYPRPARVEWVAVTGATLYYIYGEDTAEGVAANRWSFRWSTTNTYFIDDYTNDTATAWDGPVVATGTVKLTPVGIRISADGTIWHEYEVARHACKEIVKIYVDGVEVDSQYFGTYALVPGKPGYGTYFPDPGVCQYRDVDGIRRTSVFGRGEVSDQVFRGEKTLTASVRGVETNGDSSGEVITNIFDIYRYILKNLVFGNQLTGPVPPPYFPNSGVFADPIPIINEASFQRCKEITQVRMPPNGYTGALVLGSDGERIQLRELIQRLNVSAGCWSTWNFVPQLEGSATPPQYGFTVFMIDENLDLATTRHFVGEENIPQTEYILKESFYVTTDAKTVRNVIEYNSLYDFARSRWAYELQTRTDDTSVLNMTVTRKSPTVEYYYTRNTTQVDNLNGRKLSLEAVPSRIAAFATIILSSLVPVGDTVRITHLRGIGANGYVEHPVLVRSRSLNLKNYRTDFVARDLASYIDANEGGGVGAGCTSVIAYNYTSASAPAYPDNSPGGPTRSLPNYWQDPSYPGDLGWGAPVAAFPNELRAENVNIVSNRLTYLSSDPIISGIVYGDPNYSSLFALDSLFTTWGVNRTIFASATIDMDTAIYDAGDVIYAPIFRIFGRTCNGGSYGAELAVDDTDATGDIDLLMSTNWIGPGSGMSSVVIATIPRANWVGQTKTVRLEVRPSSPVDPADDQNFDHNADGVVRLYIDGVLIYENTAVNFVLTSSGLADMTEAYTVGGIGLGDAGFPGSYHNITFGYCDGYDPPHAVWPPNN